MKTTKTCEFGCNGDKCRTCKEGQKSCDGEFVMLCVGDGLMRSEHCDNGCRDGACLVDANGNGMWDGYETASDRGQNCNGDDECEQFCDATKGVCSTKCRADEECVEGRVCAEGRCTVA